MARCFDTMYRGIQGGYLDLRYPMWVGGGNIYLGSIRGVRKMTPFYLGSICGIYGSAVYLGMHGRWIPQIWVP